jgi:hypothetical protein
MLIPWMIVRRSTYRRLRLQLDIARAMRNAAELQAGATAARFRCLQMACRESQMEIDGCLAARFGECNRLIDVGREVPR